jgi:FixJ family two-component response regulator
METTEGRDLKREDCDIFIIDDDVSLAKALARLLKSTGFSRVSTFPSAEEFIQKASMNGNSIIILDLQLPGMSGIDLMENLRKSGHDTPIILISAHEEELARARGMDHVGAAFLHKPFEENELISVISALAAP